MSKVIYEDRGNVRYEPGDFFMDPDDDSAWILCTVALKDTMFCLLPVLGPQNSFINGRILSFVDMETAIRKGQYVRLPKGFSVTIIQE